MNLFSKKQLILLFVSISISASSQLFPEPDIIKGNVQFWRKIYSEILLEEGLLHDRDYPMIIYEKIDLSSIPERKRSEHIESRKRKYATILKGISERSGLDEEQKRILELFKTHASVEAIEGASDRIRFQLGQKQRFKQGLERSYMYLDTISSILKKYGLPDQLKYLPHVESSFDPKAYSRLGAAGIWQFMRSTGKLFMTINYDIDQRMDPIIASDAAARLLSLNFEKLQSWPLAITAYNHGLSGMKRAVNALGTNDIGEILLKHESPSFKFASKNFYAAFIAAMRLADSAFHYFPDLVPQKAIACKTLTIDIKVSPSQLCQMAGISLDLFKQCNPSIRPSVYSQQKEIPLGYSVSFPDTVSIEKVQLALAALKSQLPQESSEKGAYYTVRRGDNLIGIARKYGVSPSELASINSIGKINRIFEGQVLRIPGKAEVPAVALSDSDTTSNEAADSVTNAVNLTDSSKIMEILSEEMKTDSSTAGADSAKGSSIHIINGTLLSSPAVSLNETGNEDSADNSAGQFDATVYDLGLKMVPGASSVSIRVNIGESVIRYAEWMNVPVSSIIRLNNMKNFHLRLGKRISIPVYSHSDLKKFETNRLEYLMAIEEDFYSRYEVVDQFSYTLKRGDSFWKISSLNKIPLWLLKKFNKEIDFSSPRRGTSIRIPVVAAKDSHEPPVLEDSPTGEPVLQKETIESLEEAKE